MSQPKQTQLVVKYGGTVKAAQSHNKFENVDLTYFLEETYDVTESDDLEIAAFRGERLKALSAEVGDTLVERYNQVKSGQLGTPDDS